MYLCDCDECVALRAEHGIPDDLGEKDYRARLAEAVLEDAR